MPPRLARRPPFGLGASAGVLLGAATAFALDLDLTTTGSSGSIGAGVFQQTGALPTGTGVIDPFLRLSADGEEQGFNTDHIPLQGDLKDVKPGRWTHSLPVGDLEPVLLGGVLHMRFLLDINERAASSLLSLDELKVFTAPVPDLGSNAELFAENLLYDMGAGNRVRLDYALNAGSGSGDMFFYLPAAVFAGLEAQYLYLYSKFGASGGSLTSDDGFEEWAQLLTPVPVKNTAWSAVKRLYRD